MFTTHYSVNDFAFEEGGRLGILWFGEEGFGGGDFDETAVYEQGGAVGEAAGLEDVVGDENGCGVVLGVFFADDAFDEADVVGVEVGGGFVEEEDVGPDEQGADEGYSLRFAGGELAGGLVGEGVQAKAVEPNAGRFRGQFLTAQGEAVAEIGEDAAFEEQGLLEDGCDAAALGEGEFGRGWLSIEGELAL